ncbi:uncharacterized protein LOC125508681 isoform X1 [Triticum urartu]|uniref:uncharacterized protein LOC125508681 isoform X1 n=1 Tax=Triticum urartu TaxID=4572 RepID=UPI002042CEB6|nr:uncharacterized protein LOC125508681 isoform X1 [Triticum urartu]
MGVGSRLPSNGLPGPSPRASPPTGADASPPTGAGPSPSATPSFESRCPSTDSSAAAHTRIGGTAAFLSTASTVTPGTHLHFAAVHQHGHHRLPRASSRLLIPARSGTSPHALLQRSPRPGLGRVRSAAPVRTSALRHAVGMQKEHLGFGGQAHHEVLVGMRGMTRMLRETSLLDPDLSLLVFSHLNKFKKNLIKICFMHCFLAQLREPSC